MYICAVRPAVTSLLSPLHLDRLTVDVGTLPAEEVNDLVVPPLAREHEAGHELAVEGVHRSAHPDKELDDGEITLLAGPHQGGGSLSVGPVTLRPRLNQEVAYFLMSEVGCLDQWCRAVRRLVIDISPSLDEDLDTLEGTLLGS